MLSKGLLAVLLTLFNVDSFASLCSSYEALLERDDVSIYEVTYSHINEKGTGTIELEPGDPSPLNYEYLIVVFNVSKTIKGKDLKEVFVEHRLGYLLGGKLPELPKDLNQRYVMSFFNSDKKVGNLDSPFLRSTCDLYKRI